MKNAAQALQTLFFCALVGAGHSAQARDLSGRFGFGVSDLGPGLKPALSVDWQLSSASAVEFLMSLDSNKKDSHLGAGVRLQRNLFIESAQHFFLYVGAGLRQIQTDGSGQSGYRLEGGAGSKFFFTELPNLGLGFGGGFDLNSGDGARFASRAHLSAHYYF